jgi:DnaJ-domain-containing protein 1
MAQAKTKTVPEKVLEFVDMSAAMAEKAASALSRQEQMVKQAAELIPTAVDELLKAKLIEPEEKQAALDALKDPVRVLQVLIKTARSKQDSNAITLGEPAANGHQANGRNGTEKRANYAGHRHGEAEEPESYRVFRSRLMGGN